MPLTRTVRVDPRHYDQPLQAGSFPLTILRRVTHDDLTTASTTHTLDIANIPGFVEIEGVVVNLITNFTGGGVTAATLIVGGTGTPATNAYVTSSNIFTGAPKFYTGVALAPGVGMASATPGAGGTIRMTFTTTTANASALTAGVLEVAIKLRAIQFRTT